LFLATIVIVGLSDTTLFFKSIGAWYAVNFFFIISGFYIVMVINEGYIDAKPLDFYKRRTFRIFPVYYVGLLLMLLASFYSIKGFFGAFIISAKLFYIFKNIFIVSKIFLMLFMLG